ncbi:MAG: OmpH family outer membrane protein [Acidobacteriota bacterium]
MNLPFPADAKIAFVNMQLIVNDSKLGKSGQDKLKALTDKRTTDVTAKNGAIQAKQLEVQNGQNVLTPTVLAQKTSELEALQRELQFMQQQAQTELQNLNEQLLGEFSDRVLPIIEQIRSEKSLLVVFTSGDGSNVAAINPAIDLSAEVVKRLDAAQ